MVDILLEFVSTILATPRSEILPLMSQGRQQHTVGRQVTMDDGITSIVKVSQTNSHILKDGAVDLLGHDTIAVQALCKSGGQELHYQNWCIGVHLKVDAQELDNVWVSKLAKQPAFILETPD